MIPRRYINEWRENVNWNEAQNEFRGFEIA